MGTLHGVGLVLSHPVPSVAQRGSQWTSGSTLRGGGVGMRALGGEVREQPAGLALQVLNSPTEAAFIWQQWKSNKGGPKKRQ